MDQYKQGSPQILPKGINISDIIRLKFSNDVKIHVIVMFSDQQFVDINEGIHASQVHAHRCQLYL